ncbi:MAG: hypothetical protein ACOCUS_00170 [Polyangiales bacterium]
MAALAAASLVPTARAEEPHVELTLTPPERLEEGDRARVVAEVRRPEGNDRPLLLTPSSEGTAVEVVRGRLLRADAEDPDARVLRFRIPIVARSPGTAVLRAEVLAHHCTRRCRPLRARAATPLRVHRH